MSKMKLMRSALQTTKFAKHPTQILYTRPTISLTTSGKISKLQNITINRVRTNQ